MINNARRKSTIIAITAACILLSVVFGLFSGLQRNYTTLTFSEFRNIMNGFPDQKRIMSVITSPGSPVEVHLNDDSIQLLEASNENKEQAIELLNEQDIPIYLRGRDF